MYLTDKQKIWLYSRGERSEFDVIVDESGNLCVEMYFASRTFRDKNKTGMVLVKIPHDEDINLPKEIMARIRKKLFPIEVKTEGKIGKKRILTAGDKLVFAE